MITGLILVGLIIDLGGAPNHERLGFQVQSSALYVWSTADRDYSTGRTLVSLLVQAWSLTTLALIASSESSLYWCRLHSHSREWNLLPCRCCIICQGKPLTDGVYSAASETENPRRNIAKAVRRVFYRICIFYVSCPPVLCHLVLIVNRSLAFS